MKKSKTTKDLYKATFTVNGKTHIIMNLSEADLDEVKTLSTNVIIEKI